MSEFSSNKKFLCHKSIGINTNSVFCSLCGTDDYIAFSNGDKELSRPGFVPLGLFNNSVGESISDTLMGGREVTKVKEFKGNFSAPVPYGFYYPLIPLAYSPLGFSTSSFCVPASRRFNQEEKDRKSCCGFKSSEDCGMSSVSEESKVYSSEKCEGESESQNEKFIDTNFEWDNKDEAIGCLKMPSKNCMEILKEKSESEFGSIEDRGSSDGLKVEKKLESEENLTNKPKDETKLRKSRFQTLTTTNNKPISNEEQKKAQIFIRDIIEQMKDKPEPQKVCHTILNTYHEKTKDFLPSKSKNVEEDKKFKDFSRPSSKSKSSVPKESKPSNTPRKNKKIPDDATKKKIWAI